MKTECEVCGRVDCGVAQHGERAHVTEAAEHYRLGYTRLRSALADIVAELRNYVTNGSDPVKHIRGLYADLEKSTAALAVERTRRKGVEEALRLARDWFAQEAEHGQGYSWKMRDLMDTALSSAEGQPPEGAK